MILNLPTGYGHLTVTLYTCRDMFKMAESKTVLVVPLNNSNYCTWKIQCKMALIKDGLWGIVYGTEIVLLEGDEAWAKYAARCEKALAKIVLSMEPNLLGMIHQIQLLFGKCMQRNFNVRLGPINWSSSGSCFH